MRYPAIDAQCQSGGFDEFLIAMNWLVLQLGGAKHVHTKRVVEFRDGWPPAWPLLALTLGSCDCGCCDGSFYRRPLVPRPESRLPALTWRLHCYGYWEGCGGSRLVRISCFGLQEHRLALTGTYFGLV
jgi:hypothetical protein